MKKLLSIVLVVAFVLSMSVSAMALKSPGGTEYNKVYINQTHTGSSSAKIKADIVVAGNTIEIAAKPVAEGSNLKFNGYAVYKDAQAKKPAKIGTDFEVVKVLLSTGVAAVKGVDYTEDANTGKINAIDNKAIKIVIKPLVDNLYISDVHSKVTAAGSEQVTIKFNVEEELDKTSDSSYNAVSIAALLLIVCASAAAMIYSKREFN